MDSRTSHSNAAVHEGIGFIQLQKEAGYCTPDCIGALNNWMDNGGHFA